VHLFIGLFCLALTLGCSIYEPPKVQSPEKELEGTNFVPKIGRQSERRWIPLEAYETRFIIIKNQRVKVYIADSIDKRTEGLMHISTDELKDNEGMLFIFDQEERLSFWMKNTIIPLDIAYVDKNGKIVDIQQMQPLRETGYPSKSPAKYAIEMKQGWFQEHKIKIGDDVDLSTIKQQTTQG
jgi:uncharacterized membrane protein (UPF0127 family)